MHTECFERLYSYNLSQNKVNIKEFADEIKKMGKTCLMCTEQFPKPNKGQNYGCHRDLLIEKIIEIGIFEKRKDL